MRTEVPKRTGTTRKASLNIPVFSGINVQHTRKIGEPSAGKNFVVQNGMLRTRDGCSLVTSSFPAAIKSIHQAPKVGMDTKLIVEAGNNIYHRTTEAGAWSAIQSASTNYGFSSVLWAIVDENGSVSSNLYLAGGGTNKLYVYSIDTGGISVWSNFSPEMSGVMPTMEFLCKHEGRMFGWGLNSAYPNRMYFCGYDETDAKNVSAEYWPEDFWLDVSGSAAEPVLDAVSLGGHMLVLTPRRHYRVYFSDETNNSTDEIGKVGMYKIRCAAKVGNYCLWLTQEDGKYRVYAYSGSEAVPVSQNVEELFAGYSFTNAFAFENGGEFWLVLPGSPTNKTTVFVYDLKDWFIYEYPFVINCAGAFGAVTGREYVHLGLNDNRIVKLDGSLTDLGVSITSELVIGPLSSEGRKTKIKRLWLTAEPDNDFDIDVYSTSDREAEGSAITAEFTAGVQETVEVKITGTKGRNNSLRLSATDRISGLESGSITAVVGAVK